MLNNNLNYYINKSHVYFLFILKLINIDDFKEIKKCNYILNLLIFLSNDKIIVNYYIKYKIFFIKKILYILNKYINLMNFRKIIKIILEDNMFFYVNFILTSFVNFMFINKKFLFIKVISKNKISKVNTKLIKKFFIKRYYKYRLCFFFKRCKKLIAGFKVYINDLVYDFSILNIIDKIKLFYK